MVLPCTSEVATCGDTCGKLLECGIHECVERCHKSSCGTVSPRNVLLLNFEFTIIKIFFSACRCELGDAVVV